MPVPTEIPLEKSEKAGCLSTSLLTICLYLPSLIPATSDSELAYLYCPTLSSQEWAKVLLWGNASSISKSRNKGHPLSKGIERTHDLQ